jgi:hypothetical protein
MRNFFLGILSSIIILICSIQIQAQEADTLELKPEYKHGIGAAAGYTTGYGLSYMYRLNKFSIQAAFSPYVENKDEMQFSTGLSFMYRLVEAKHVNLFLYEGNHWYYSKQLSYNSNYYYPYDMDIDVDNYFHCGVGFGFEFKLGNRLSYNLMVGYSARENFEKIKPTIETGLFYKF